MAVDKIFQPLFYSLGRVRAEIKSLSFRRMASGANALYEALFDDKTPNTATQTVKGHNHAENGGWAFIRGLCWSEDKGSSPIVAFETTKQDDVGSHSLSIGFSRYEVSPNLDDDGRLECWILYSCEGSDFDMVFIEHESGSPVTLEENVKLGKTFESGGSQIIKWKQIFLPLASGLLNGGRLRFQNKTWTKEQIQELRIYSLSFAETAVHSYQPKGRVL